MKNILKITLGLLAGLFVMVGCDDKDNAASVAFSVDKEDVLFSAEGGKESFNIEAAGEWSLSVNVPWVSVTPANGVGSATCEVKVDSSLVNDVRETDIIIASGIEDKFLHVLQAGFEKMILPREKEIEIDWTAEYGKRFFELVVATNVEFDVEFRLPGEEKAVTPDWVEVQKYDVTLEYGARPRNVKLRFDWMLNAESVVREVEIHFVPRNGETIGKPAVVKLTQKASVKIEDNRSGDSIALLTIYDLFNCMTENWDTSERMDNWEGVALWEANDKDLPHPEAVGRVRTASYAFLRTKESLPKQIRHLKYLENLTIMSNVNTMLLSIDLGPEICELVHLKNLDIFAYGLVSLPEEFKNLQKLEVLSLSANNFNDIPAVLTPENLPNLKVLQLVGERRWTLKDLTKKGSYDDGIGLNILSTTDETNRLRDLFLWEGLEELRLQNCYIEGELPDFKVGEEGVKSYAELKNIANAGERKPYESVIAMGDTLQWLVDNDMPVILPNMKMLAINLNFFTGKLPDWLLYHPRLIDFIPELLIFNQQEGGLNSNGDKVGFDNAPANFDYYYGLENGAFPKMNAKYDLKDVIEDEE